MIKKSIKEQCLLHDTMNLKICIQNNQELFLPIVEFALQENLANLLKWLNTEFKTYHDLQRILYECACFYGNWTLIEKFQHTAWGMYSAIRGNQMQIVNHLDEILQTNYSKEFALNLTLDNDKNDELVDFFLAKNPNVYSWKPLFEYSCEHKSLKYANICIIDKKYKPNNEDFVFICSCGNIEWLQFIDMSKIPNIDLSRGLGIAFKQKTISNGFVSNKKYKSELFFRSGLCRI